MLIAAFSNEDAADQALQNMKEAKKQGQFYYEIHSFHYSRLRRHTYDVQSTR